MRLQEIEIDSIIVGERFRQDLGDIEELATSIGEKGILQPITVEPEEIEGGGYRLVAGGRRVAACKLLGLARIPALIRESKGELDLRECELYENIYRKDLAWQERCRLEREIYRLRGKSFVDLEQELDTSKSLLARHVQLADAMDLIPELGKHAQESDAWKAYKRIEEELVVGELAKRAEQQLIEGGKRDERGPHYGIDLYKAAAACYRIGDALIGMQEVQEVITLGFDLAEVDPPYGIDLPEMRKRDSQAGLPIDEYTEIPREEYAAFLRQAAESVYALLKDNSWCIWWFGIEHYELVSQTMQTVGFTSSKVPSIWAKKRGQTKQPDVNLANCYETFFLLRKGSPVLRRPGRSNVFEFENVHNMDAELIHASQRPIDLMLDLLDTLCLPGSRILCPFLGSGVTLRAAFSRGMTGMGWDLNEGIRNRFLLQVKEDIEKGRYGGGNTDEAPDPGAVREG